MRRPTPSQLTFAQSLVLRLRDAEARVRSLARLRDAARIAVDTRQRRLYETTLFAHFPERLAGALVLYRDGGSVTRDTVRRNYFDLLHQMLEGDGLTGSKPKRVDFAALLAEARPFLVAPFVGLTVGGVFPRLCLDRSVPGRSLTYVMTGGPAEPADWRVHMPAIAAWLGGEWELTHHTANTVTLTCRTPLPAAIPFEPAMLKRDHVFLGIDVATRRPHHVPIADLAHMLITGTTGMGKSVALDAILQSLFASAGSLEHVYACDPAGVAFSRYKGAHRKLTTLSKPRDLWAVVARLAAHMEEREAELEAQGRAKFADRFIVLIVDEFPAYGTADTDDKKSDDWKAHQTFIADVMRLGRRARKTGIKLVLVVQEPTDRDISTGVRSVLPGALVFRTPVQAHVTNLFSDVESLPAHPRSLPRGRALYRDGISGETRLVQFPIFPDRTARSQSILATQYSKAHP